MTRLSLEESQTHGVQSTPQSAADDESLLDQLRTVASARCYFLHHSVGRNVLDGVRRLYAEAGVPEPGIAEISSGADAADAAVVCENGGENGRPRSKVDAFADRLRSIEGVKPDVAFMKFCFVDFNPQTDWDAEFTYYCLTIDALKREFPQTRFAHATVPLVVQSDSLKDRVKRLIGREVWEDASNVNRNLFSRKLRATYEADPILDLETIQSTRPDGSREEFSVGGFSYYSMHPGYSYDGGHLNRRGARVAALAFVRFLATAIGQLQRCSE